MELWIGAIDLGLGYAFLAMGVFITMRIYNFPDITADGSLTLGASITAALLVAGVNAYIAVAAAILAGFVAGAATGLIHTKLKVNGLLSGILVTTALYSVNLRITGGRSNVPLIVANTLLTPLEKNFSTLPRWAVSLGLFIIFAAVALALLSMLFKTDFGLAMRSTGDNEIMTAAQGVSTDTMKIIGIGLSNALIAFSGALVCQYQGFSDINMGVGIVVFGLASVIIGESVLGFRKSPNSITIKLVSVVFGAVLFRELVAAALKLGLNPTDFKLINALFVLGAVSLPQLGLRRAFKL
ncbi:MAG: ABC transporter permease [Rhizobacter sp.]|nr:ABC transporter permease [Chlorobiales bacterium]